MEFEWDKEKALSNERKHGVGFLEAMTVFADSFALTGYDLDHSDDEDRYITMGYSEDGRLLIICHTDRGDVIRLISARVATRAEKKDYEDGNFP
jgi:uncharacterized protein